MAGNKPLLVLQTRDFKLMQALEHFRVIDRDQARVVAPFGSITRANTRLLRLVAAGLLTKLTVGTTRGGHKHLYALTRQGALAVGIAYRPPPWNPHSPIVAGQPLLEHQLRLNELHLAFHSVLPETGIRVSSWRTFNTPPVSAAPNLIPDAYVVLNTGSEERAFFVEVDLATEPLRTWRQKVEKYLSLARSGAFRETFSAEQFGVLVTLPSARRLQTVSREIAARTTKIFWLTVADNVRADIATASVWYRPGAAVAGSLINPRT